LKEVPQPTTTTYGEKKPTKRGKELTSGNLGILFKAKEKKKTVGRRPAGKGEFAGGKASTDKSGIKWGHGRP